MKSSRGKNVKKSRSLKRIKAARNNLKKALEAKRKVDWVRLEKYKANRLAGMNRFQSALKAGYAYSTARHQSCRFDKLAKVDIQTALENAGATNQVMAEHLTDLALNATKRQRCTVEIRQEDDEIIVDDQAAEVVPDLHLRKESWELIAKLKQQLKPTPIIPEGGFKRMVLVIEKEVSASDPSSDTAGRVEVDAPTRLSVAIPVEQG